MISTPSLRSSLALVGAAGLVLASASAHAFEPGDVFAGVDGQLRAFSKNGSHLVTVDLGGSYSTGACLLPNGHLLVTTWYDNQIIEVGGAGQWIGPWGNRTVDQPESCVVDATNGWVYFGQGFSAAPYAEPHPQVHRFSLDGTWSRAFDVDYGWDPAGMGSASGTDTMALAPDGCTLAYASQGQVVRHYDVCRDVQMAPAQPLPVMQLAQMAFAPNGDLFVSDLTGVWRIPAGTDVPDFYFRVQDTLDPGYTPYYLYGLAMADSKHFVVGDGQSGHIYRHNIETDLTVQVIDSYANTGGMQLQGVATIFESSGPTEGVPPLCACADRVVDADENCQAAADVNAGTTGLPVPTCTASPTAPYAAGDTDVTLTCNSAVGSCQCVGRVTVRDVTPPVAFNCPAADLEVGCSQGAAWAITGADACGATTVHCTSGGNVVTPGAIFPPGTSMVTCVVRDAAGNSSAPCNFNVVVTGGSVATPPTQCDGLWDKCQTNPKYCDKYEKYCTGAADKCDGLEDKCLRTGKYCDKYQKYCLGWTKCETLEASCFVANDTKACDKLDKYCLGVDAKPTKCEKLSDKCLNEGKYCDKYAKYCTDNAKPEKCDKLEEKCLVDGKQCDKLQKHCLGGAKPEKCDKLFTKCGSNPGSNYCEKYAKYCTDTAKPDKCDKLEAKCQSTGRYCDKYAKYCTESVSNPKCDDYEQKCLVEGKYCDKYERYCAETCAPPPAPTCLCKSVTVYASGVGMAVPSIDNGSTSSDGSPLSCIQTPGGPFATGTVTATLSCTAAGGASCSCQGDITVTSVPPAPKPAVDIYEDEEPYQSWERERERACLTATWPFKLSDCFENPPIDQLSGGPIVDNPAVGRITRVEWWPNVEAGANAATRATQVAEWRASYQKRGACQGGPLEITGPTTVNLPLDELEDPHQLYSVYRIYYSLNLGGSTTNNVCYFRLRGRFDDDAKIAALAASKQPVPGACTVCTSSDNSCGACPGHAQVCAGADTKGNCKK